MVQCEDNSLVEIMNSIQIHLVFASILLLTHVQQTFLTCLIINPGPYNAVPGEQCNIEAYNKWVRQIYELASIESCTIGLRGKAYKEVVNLFKYIKSLEASVVPPEIFARSVCIGKAPMDCVKDKFGFYRCACIDDGYLYQFVDDVDTCAVKKGGYCAPLYASVLQCELGTECNENRCVSYKKNAANTKLATFDPIISILVIGHSLYSM